MTLGLRNSSLECGRCHPKTLLQHPCSLEKHMIYLRKIKKKKSIGQIYLITYSIGVSKKKITYSIGLNSRMPSQYITCYIKNRKYFIILFN
jgi:hypothetical protein